MTSLQLLGWIAGGILLQIAIYLGIGFLRHWRGYQALRAAAADFEIAVQPEASALEPQASAAAWPGLRTFRVERRAYEDAAQQVCSFYLAPQDGGPLPAFLPGQFLTFQLELPSPAGVPEPVIRCYSLSDAPQPTAYRVSIKRAPAPSNSGFAPGRSSNYFHDHLAVGSLLQARAPAGHFHIDRSDAPVVLVGGGIGITPMLSMLNGCMAEQPGREVWLFYGVRNGAELVMLRHLQALAAAHRNFHLHLCFSDPQAADLVEQTPSPCHRHHSRADVALMRRLLPLRPYHFYICGPTPMLQSLVPALEDWGVADAHIHFEAFGPASIPRRKATGALPAASGVPGGATPAHTQEAILVTFSQSAKQFPWQPGSGSLLEFAQAHGIVVNSGCRAGGCGSCQTTIRAGEVVYSQTPDYDPDPGSCLLCVCTPKTPVTLEA